MLLTFQRVKSTSTIIVRFELQKSGTEVKFRTDLAWSRSPFGVTFGHVDPVSWKKSRVAQMRDIDQVLQLWRDTEKAGQSAVLATVVKTSGSSYRLPGARLLLTRTGQRAGSISGGCLEDDLIKKAWWLSENGPALRKYDTTPEGEIGSGFGLGCNGVIHVLLERLHPSRPTF